MTGNAPLTLEPDLQHGVVPISKAGMSLAALIKRAREQRRPIVVTQKGYPSGVLLSIEMYLELRRLIEGHHGDEGSAGK